jgi:hypothetical protein
VSRVVFVTAGRTFPESRLRAFLAATLLSTQGAPHCLQGLGSAAEQRGKQFFACNNIRATGRFLSDLPRKGVGMRLDEKEVNNYLRPILGHYEDSMQQTWLEIVERDPQTLEEIPPIARRIRNRAVKQLYRCLHLRASHFALIRVYLRQKKVLRDCGPGDL